MFSIPLLCPTLYFQNSNGINLYTQQSKQHATQLVWPKTFPTRYDMDHLYVPLLHYIWALIFIGPQAGLLWISGFCKLALRKLLCKVGIVHPKPYNPAEIVGQLCLEGTMAIHYKFNP